MASAIEGVRALADLAMAQWGLFTTAQARRVGLTRQQLVRLANEGAVERVRHGVYRVAGVPRDPRDDVRAAWLALSPTGAAYERINELDVAVISHRSAAVLHQLGDLDADVVEFSVASRKQSRDPQVKFRRRTLARGDWTVVDGLPVTTIQRTIGDLATTRTDGGHLATVVRDAITTRHVDVDAAAEALAPHAHQYGAPLGQGIVLVQRFLEQAGIPASTAAAAALTARQTRPLDQLFGAPGLNEHAQRLVAQSVTGPLMQRINGLVAEQLRRSLTELAQSSGTNQQLRAQLAGLQLVPRVPYETPTGEGPRAITPVRAAPDAPDDDPPAGPV